MPFFSSLNLEKVGSFLVHFLVSQLSLYLHEQSPIFTPFCLFLAVVLLMCVTQMLNEMLLFHHVLTSQPFPLLFQVLA